MKYIKSINEFSKYEIDPYDEEIWDPEQHYIVMLRRRVNIDNFVKKLESDGFEVLQKWSSFGFIYVRSNGRLKELQKYNEVEDARVEKIVEIS